MKRKRFSKEFKLEALRLLEQGNKAGAELAREPGCPGTRFAITWPVGSRNRSTR